MAAASAERRVPGLARARSDVRSSMRKLVFVAAWLGLCYAGCNSEDQPASQPAEAPPAAASDLTLIAPQALKWSREEACAKLGDEQLGIGAAVRLVRLAKATPLCVPEELTDATVRRLRLVRLNEQRSALGLADREDERRLRAPVLIDADGGVALPAEGTEEEVIVLHVSKDPEVFPHLLMLPNRVLLVEKEIATAIVLKPEQTVRFELRRQKGYPYIGLVLARAGELVEVARYLWDPYELAFIGPAADKLPDPPGGKFRVDLQASVRLVPQGGEIPEPDPIEPDEPDEPDWDDGWSSG